MQTGGGYTPLTAIRILDTRESGGRMTAGNRVPAGRAALVGTEPMSRRSS